MPASYIVFDILYLGQESLMDRPLLDRKSILKAELQESDVVTIIDYLPENGEAYFRAALEKGLEGIMAKRLASSYQPGIRSRDWIKIKKQLTIDLVVGGYIPGHGQREPFFGGLLLGAYDSGKLIYTGKVGSGFSKQELEEISGEFIPSDEISVLPSHFHARCKMAKARIGSRGRSLRGIQEETSQGNCIPPKKN